MRLATFGVGYVGLVTGTGLAALDHEVICVDIDPARVRQLEDGIIPVYEPGLAALSSQKPAGGPLALRDRRHSAFRLRKRLRDGDVGLAPLIDARNVWRSHEVIGAGPRYQSIGVPAISVPQDRASRTGLRHGV
jgi:hypothetical protein